MLHDIEKHSCFETIMEKTNLAPSGDHDEIAVAKETVSRPYSDSEPHEKADDEVSVSHIPITYTEYCSHHCES